MPRVKKTWIIATVILVAVFLIIALAWLIQPKPGVMVATPVCRAVSPQFYCVPVNFVYHYTSGNITFVLLMNTSSNWESADIMFVPANAVFSNGVPEVSWADSYVMNNVSTTNFTAVNVTLKATGPVPFATSLNGTIWARYQLTAGGVARYMEIAKVTVPAS